MRSPIRRIGVVVLAALVAGVAGPTATAEPAQNRSALRKAMSELVDAGMAGVQIRLHDERGDWVGRAGTRQLDSGRPVPTNGHFRAGDITMTFISAVVLQLVGERRVELDAPVDRYLPEFGLDSRITVRMLLQHTSGLYNYADSIPLNGQEFVDRRFHTYRPAELVRLAVAKPAQFEPGTAWSSVRTNYVLAGLLIERVTGTSYARQVQRRIIGPLRLRGTSMPGTRVDLPNPYAHGYLAYTHQGQRKVVDISLVNPSWAGASGEIISTTKDLDTFISAMLGGRLLKPELVTEMLTVRPVVPGFGYGLGLVRADFDERCGGTLYGHDSGGLGYSTLVLSRADRSKRYEISATIGNVDITDPTEQQRLFTALQRVHDAALCDGDAVTPRR